MEKTREDGFLETLNELVETIQQMPLSDLMRLEKALENTTTFAEATIEYCRLKSEQEEHNQWQIANDKMRSGMVAWRGQPIGGSR
jgi:hypothetical protein